MSEQATNHGVNKTQHNLVATDFIRAVADVMADSLKTGKYKKNDWRKGRAWCEIYDKVQRHLTDWVERKDIDPESGRSALHHAAADLMILIFYEINNVGTDDRWKNG